MNHKQIKQELQSKYPGKPIFYNDDRYPSEIICEIQSSADNQDYSLAIAVIDKSIPHVHRHLVETYKVISGQLKVFLNRETHILNPGESLLIKPNQPHWAEGESTWIECHSEPGWYPDDHIIAGEGVSLYSNASPPPKTWINPKVVSDKSAIQGKGLFAKSAINKGEVVLIWGGEYTDAVGARLAEKQGKLVMRWDTDLFSVEDKRADDGYFINHSCDSSLWMVDAFTLTARRNTGTGEEITVDYALWEDEGYASKWECRCGSKNCRGRVTGDDWKDPVLQKLYQGHFSPLISKKIDKFIKK